MLAMISCVHYFQYERTIWLTTASLAIVVLNLLTIFFRMEWNAMIGFNQITRTRSFIGKMNETAAKQHCT